MSVSNAVLSPEVAGDEIKLDGEKCNICPCASNIKIESRRGGNGPGTKVENYQLLSYCLNLLLRKTLVIFKNLK